MYAVVEPYYKSLETGRRMSVLAKVYTCAVVGLDGELVQVEVDIASGLPAFHVVGLPDAAVQEAGDKGYDGRRH